MKIVNFALCTGGYRSCRRLVKLIARANAAMKSLQFLLLNHAQIVCTFLLPSFIDISNPSLESSKIESGFGTIPIQRYGGLAALAVMDYFNDAICIFFGWFIQRGCRVKIIGWIGFIGVSTFRAAKDSFLGDFFWHFSNTYFLILLVAYL
jgi:hypothetical protein